MVSDGSINTKAGINIKPHALANKNYQNSHLCIGATATPVIPSSPFIKLMAWSALWFTTNIDSLDLST